MPSKIEWTDETWNPVVGCTKCSPGCLNCYAERMAHRLKHICLATNNNPQYLGKTDDDGHWTGEVECCDWKLKEPLRWRKPRRIFVCSMSDLFHPKVPFEFICKVFETIQNAGQHTYLILTKRVKEMKEFFQECEDWDASEWPNIHLGVTICNQKELDEIMPIALQISGFDWISFEPLLSEIRMPLPCKESVFWSGLKWVIVGGESGPGARPMHPACPRNIRDQCVANNVPFYFKQWGKWGIAELIPNDNQKRFRIKGTNNIISPNTIFKIFPEHELSTIPLTGWVKVGKKKAGCLLDGKEWKQLPERK